MVDPNRKINRLTDKDIEFLEECEQEFALRYTEEDAEFMKHCSKPLDDPPIVENWTFVSGGYESGARKESGSRNHYRGRNHYQRNWRGNPNEYRNYRHRRGGRNAGGGPMYSDRSDARYKGPIDQKYRPPTNVRRDYNNFVAASKDE